MNDVLFVGGPLDGQRKPDPGMGTVYFKGSLMTDDGDKTHTIASYRREDFYIARKHKPEYVIFVSNDMTIGQAIERLAEAYPKRDREREGIKALAQMIQSLAYGPYGDCGARRLAEQIEELCEEVTL